MAFLERGQNSESQKCVQIFDYLEHDLFGLARRGKRWETSEVKTIFKQICEGVAEMHRRSLAHLDLKTSNVLVNSNGKVKVADFGNVLLPGARKTVFGGLTTLLYRAPEQLFGSQCRVSPFKEDAWSLGCILGELLLGRPLFFQCMNEKEYVENLFFLFGKDFPRKESPLGSVPFE